MKGGKDEKIMGPMFPRLHVNDTEKGGPRAPPRNKMALYEQLCIPSQRSNSGSASAVPLPRNNAVSLVPSASSSQGVGHEKTVFSPLYIPSPTPAQSAEKLHSRSSEGVNFNTTMTGFERRSMKDYRTLNATEHLSSTAEYNSFRPYDFSNPKDSKLGDDDDFRVPAFHSGIAPCPSKSPQSLDRERPTPFSPSHPGRYTVISESSTLKTAGITCSSSMQLRNARDKHLKRTNTTDMMSRQHGRNQSEEHLKEYVIREKNAESLKHNNAFLNIEHQSSPMYDFERLRNSGARFHQEYNAGLLREKIIGSNGLSAESLGALEKGNIATVIRESCSGASLGNGATSPKEAEDDGEYCEDNIQRSSQVGDLDRNDDASETSMVDSLVGLDISPDDVVGVIGQKHFWKARRAITNQQRVFAVQVFELHRLIKVQRLIAGSPHLLLEDNPYFRKASLDISPAKKLPSEYVLKSLPPIIKQKDDSQKPKQNTECAAENDVRKPSLPSPNDDVSKGLVGQHPSHGSYSGNPPPTPMSTDNNKTGPWGYYPPPGNQWLLPIMSPSEGLIYKPYAMPYPPNSGFIPPIYGGCGGPMSLPSMVPNPAYGAPPSHPPQGLGVHSGSNVPPMYFPPTYYPPYGMPIMNSANSGQAEQVSTDEVNRNVQTRNPSNLLNRKSTAMYQTSKDSELHGSTASSPCDKAHGVVAGQVSEGQDAPLHLFPMAPAVEVSSSDLPPQTQSSSQQTLVIRVVPHNARSATESAARIFRSIQEERQQCDP